MNRILIFRVTMLILIVTAILTGGCATIVKGGSQGVTVKTDPPGANCDLTRKGKSVGVVNPTPGTVQLGKGASALDVSCKKPGYFDANGKLSSSFQGWTLGNVILGGIVGIVVDAGSGAMHEYQSEISMKLLPESFGSNESRDAYFNSWRDDLLGQSEKAKGEIAEKCGKSRCEKLLIEVDKKAREAIAEVEIKRQGARILAADGSVAQSPVRVDD